MSIRELMGWRDLLHIVVAALAVTLIVCGGAYLGAGGPVPGMIGSADASVTASIHPAKALKMISPAQVTKPVTVKAVVADPRAYQVLSGDTLSSISAHLYGSSVYWTTIYWANKGSIKYANIIYVGQNLTIPAVPHVLATPSIMSPAPPPQPQQDTVTVSASNNSGGQSKNIGSYGHPYYCGDGDGDGYDIPCSSLHDTDSTPAVRVGTAASASYSGGGGFQSCVIARESGGNSQIVNASGHYGLYQFSASTWAAYGGNPADFGNASVPEQNQVFANAMATAGGASNWSPYDGC